MKRIFQINSSEIMLFIFKRERELKRAVPSLEYQEVRVTDGVATTDVRVLCQTQE